MNKLYLRPAIANAGALESSAVDIREGLFPLVEAAAAGYMAGKQLKKVLGGAIPSSMITGLVKRKKFDELGDI